MKPLASQDTSQLRLYNCTQVLKILATSRSAWYAGIKAGIYPPGIKLGRRSRRWSSDQIEKLIQDLSK